ncbi:MAG: hypothetical protein ACXW20_12860 [Burkholderiales bacterium]
MRTLRKIAVAPRWLGVAITGAVLALVYGNGDVHAATDSGTPSSGWAVDPAVPGENLPPAGRSLFDFLVVREDAGRKVYDVPFPITALIKRIEAGLEADRTNAMPVKRVLIPLGRSLQRTSAAPHYFAFPRLIAVPDAEPRLAAKSAGMLLKDRLYLGFQEKADVIEVISYNEAAGRFEFQLIKDYRPGSKPRVFYANRAVCTACHQNAAPIFSRPVWDETNANTRVAALLRKERPDFYGTAPERGVDVPNAIDDATDRANLLSAYQFLWRWGCESAGEPSSAARCRAGLFAAALQHRLSGRQQFDADAPRYRDDVLAIFGKSASGRPALLKIPNPDIPNRDPFMRSGALAGVQLTSTDANGPLVEVLPAFDPLVPRAPLEEWPSGDPATVSRLVSGLSEFIAESDVKRVDVHLRRVALRDKRPRTLHESDCRVTRPAHAPRQHRVDFECSAAGAPGALTFAAAGRFYVDGDRITGGTLDRLKLSGEKQANALLTVLDIAAGRLARLGIRMSATLRRPRGDAQARRGDGDPIDTLKVEWPTEGNAQGHAVAGRAVVTVLHDFEPVQQAIDHMLKQNVEGSTDVFSDKPFRRASLMPALFAQLGLPTLDWCCVDTTGMPPARMESHADAGDADRAKVKPVDLQPFYRYCATCHQTAERFPPNFLQGSVAQVSANLSQCAPRLYARLSMWKVAEHERLKTPMPPHYALHGFQVSPDAWRGSSELAAMIDYVERSLQTGTGQAPRPEAVMRRGYENLPACLP